MLKYFCDYYVKFFCRLYLLSSIFKQLIFRHKYKMPKYFCDYCDTYLTHDSPSVRKTHCGGRRHRDNVRLYYQQWMEDQAQEMVNKTTQAFEKGQVLDNTYVPGLTSQPICGSNKKPEPPPKKKRVVVTSQQFVASTQPTIISSQPAQVVTNATQLLTTRTQLLSTRPQILTTRPHILTTTRQPQVLKTGIRMVTRQPQIIRMPQQSPFIFRPQVLNLPRTHLAPNMQMRPMIMVQGPPRLRLFSQPRLPM